MENARSSKKATTELSPAKRRDLERLMQLPKRKRDMLIAVAAGMMLVENTKKEG